MNASPSTSGAGGMTEQLRSVGRDTLSKAQRRAPFVVVLYVLVSGMMWAAATPLAGVPDEPSHVVYAAATVRGTSGEVVPADSDRRALVSYAVPGWITSLPNKPDWPCFAAPRYTTADCQSALTESGDSAPTLTSVSRYQPIYYWIVGIPTISMTGSGALYAMRAMSVALATLLIGLGLASAAPRRRPWLSIGVLVAFTPMVAFLIGGINPNGAEIVASIGLAVAILGVADESPTTRRIWFQVASISILGSYLAWARPYSWLNLVVVAGVTLMLNRRSVGACVRSRPSAATAIGLSISVATLTAVAYDVLIQGPLRSTLQAGQRQAHPRAPFGEILATVVEKSGGFLADTIGRFGWLDHTVPWPLQIVWLMFLGALVAMAWTVGQQGDRLPLFAIVAGSVFVVPVAVMWIAFGSPWGYQARYALPLVVLVGISSVFVLGLRGVKNFQWLHRAILGGFGVFAPLTMTISVILSMSRYSIGMPLAWSDILSFEFLRDAAWLPPAEALGVVFVGLIALAAITPTLRRVGIDTTTTRFEESQRDS